MNLKILWLHPATQIVLYIALFFGLLYETWNLLGFLVPRNFQVLLMTQEVMESVYSVLCLILFVKYVQKRSFSSTGIVKKGAITETLLGFVLGFVVSGGAIAGMFLLGGYHPFAINLHANLVYPLILFFFAGLVEEVIFRLFVFQTCEKRWGTVKALIITSVLFGLVHMINIVQNASFQEQLTGCVFLIFEAGFLLNAVYLINRRVWLPLGMHWAWNFFEGPVFGTIVSGQNFGASLITAQTSGPFLLTGGPFGPEGSLSGLFVGVVCGGIATWYAIKHGAWVDRSSRLVPMTSNIDEIGAGEDSL